MNVPEDKRTDKCPDYFEDDEDRLTDQPEQEGITFVPEAKFNDEMS